MPVTAQAKTATSRIDRMSSVGWGEERRRMMGEDGNHIRSSGGPPAALTHSRNGMYCINSGGRNVYRSSGEM